jgi:chromosome segregation ATPase
MSAEETVEIDDPKLQKYVLSEHEKEIAKLSQRTHDQNNTLSAIETKIIILDRKQDSISKNVDKLSTDMEEIKETLAERKGAAETKDKLLKGTFAAFAAFGAGDLVYQFFKNFPV